MRILVVDARRATPERDGGSRAVAELLDGLRQLGHDVHYFYDSHAETADDPWRWEQLAGDCGAGPDGLGRWLAANAQTVDVAIAVRPLIAARYEPQLAQYPSIAKIYLGMDNLELRALLESKLKGTPDSARRVAASRALERRCWHRYDVIAHLTVSEARLVAHDPKAGLSLTVPVLSVGDIARAQTPVAEPNLVFVGGSGYEPNRDALSWFVSDIFGRVLQRQPKTQLVVVGHWPEQLREPFSQLPAVTFAGNVSGPDIAAIYQRSRVAIAPIRFGAGVKVKVITALSYGVPVVSTAVGLAGIDISAEDDEPRDPGELGAIQADDAASFAQAVSWLINAGTAWRTYSDRGEQFVARVYSRAQFVLAWERALESAILERNRRVGETD